MAGTFVPTGSYSNLSRLELEQLRKADFFSGAKALTVGDSALSPEGVVGPGSINAEPYLTSQFTTIQELLLTPAPQPGLNLFAQTFSGGRAASITVTGIVTISGLVNPVAAPGSYIVISGASNPANNGTFKATFATSTSVTIINPNATTDSNNGSIVWHFVDDTGNWYGPTFLGGSVGGRSQGQATGTLQWTDLQNCFGSETGVPGAGMGVQTGDVLVVKYSLVGQNTNQYAVGTIAAVVNTALSGTFHVTNGLNTVTASVSQTLAQGQRVVFASQPSVYYVIQSGTGTSLTLSSNYTGTNNAATAGTSPTSLTLSSVNNSYAGSPTVLSVSSDTYSYLILRPNAVQLFAIPGSGATGSEQSFLTVVPGSPLHNSLAPTVDQINRDRLLNIIPGQYGLNSTVDRSDALFPAPAPQATSNLLGYRIVLYPDNGSGTGPNLTAPIATLSPVIDPAIPATDQRFTVDYSAGVIRFSCEPKVGGQIKVAGGVNSTTGRLNLYAVFWAINPSFAPGAASSLYAPQTTQEFSSPPARTYFNGSSWAFDSPNYLNLNTITIPVGGDVLSGAAATISAASGGVVTLTGLSGMYQNIAGSITLSGAASSGNNGTFLIDQYVSNSSVTIINPNGIFPDTNSGSIAWQLTVLPLPLMTLDVPDPTTSLVQRANAAFVLTCGDGNVSFGDFNGTDAISQAVSYWQGLSSPPLTCKIHVKHGSYQQLGGMSLSTSGQELILVGDGKSSTHVLGPTGGVHWGSSASDTQVTLEGLTLQNGGGSTSFIISGSIRARACTFIDVPLAFSNVGTPLATSPSAVYPSFANFEDCEFEYPTLGNISFRGVLSPTSPAIGFFWKNCSFSNLAGHPIFVFTANPGNTNWKTIVLEHCNFLLSGMASSSTTAIGASSGIMYIDPDVYDLTMSVTDIRFEDCNVSSTDTSSDSVIFLHLMPLAYNATGTTYRSQIGRVIIRGGTWAMPQGRGNDFVSFFLMCANPIVENLNLIGGGTAFTGFSSAPGFQGNGSYTNAMMYALTGTLGYGGISNFGTTIAASGASLFSSANSNAGFFVSFASPTMTFEDLATPGQFAPGMVGMQITIYGAAVSGNNGTFLITGYTSPSIIQYSNVSGNGTDGNSGSIYWSVSSAAKTGMVVRNIELQNIAHQSFSGDLCLVGPQINGGSAIVEGVLVTNLGGSGGDLHNPMARIYLRPGASYVPNGVTTITSGSNGLSLPQATIHVTNTGFFLPNGGTILVAGSLVTYTGTTSTTFTGCTGGSGVMLTNQLVLSNVATAVPGTNGTNGVFRGITWQALNPLTNWNISFMSQTGTGVLPTGVVTLGYNGDLHVENVKILPMLSFNAGASFPHQFDVVPMAGITCTELWGTVTPAPQRGHLRLHDVYCENLGQDFYGVAGGDVSVVSSQVEVIGVSAHYTLSDFATIEASSLETYSNFNSTSGDSLEPTGIQVVPQYSLRGGYAASITAFGSNESTIVGLTGMTAGDQLSYLIVSGSTTHSGNNGIFIIAQVLSASSVKVINASGAIDAGPLTWAVANNLTSKWSLSDCRVEFDNLATGYEAAGIQSFWTLGTAQSSQSTVSVTQGDVRGCYVNLTTANADFTSIIPLNYVFGSTDTTSGGQVPPLNCFSNAASQTSASGVALGNFETYYYSSLTKTAVSPGSLTRGFLTSFTTGQGLFANTAVMVFNNGILKTP